MLDRLKKTWHTNVSFVRIQVLFFHHLHGTHWAYGITVATVNAHVLMDDIAITFVCDGLHGTIHGTAGTTHASVFNMKVHLILPQCTGTSSSSIVLPHEILVSLLRNISDPHEEGLPASPLSKLMHSIRRKYPCIVQPS